MLYIVPKVYLICLKLRYTLKQNFCLFFEDLNLLLDQNSLYICLKNSRKNKKLHVPEKTHSNTKIGKKRKARLNEKVEISKS